MSDTDTITGMTGENDEVRRIIEWFLTYYEPSDEGRPSRILPSAKARHHAVPRAGHRHLESAPAAEEQR